MVSRGSDLGKVRRVGCPAEVVYGLLMVLELDNRLILLPGVDQGDLILVEFNYRDIVLVVLVPGDPQQLVARLIQDIRF